MIRIYNKAHGNIVGKMVVGGDSVKFLMPPVGGYVEFPDSAIHNARTLVDNSFGKLSFTPPTDLPVQEPVPAVVNELQAEIERLKAQLAEKETVVVTEPVEPEVTTLEKRKKASPVVTE